MRFVTILPALLLCAAPVVAAEGCVVDYNTLKVRPVEAQDLAMTVPEQSLIKATWANDATVTVVKGNYSKSGETRVMTAADLTFFNFKDAVPFLRDPGEPAEKPNLYALVDGATCEVQPYVPAE